MATDQEKSMANVALSEENDRLIDEVGRLRAALQGLVNDVLEYESKNNLYPNPGKKRCWQSVEYAENLLDHN